MGTCLRPSYTAIVCPTISGVIVDRRDHVLITRRSLVRLSSWIFLLRCSSTKGPFFVDRPIRYLASQSRGRAVAPSRGRRTSPKRPPDCVIFSVLQCTDRSASACASSHQASASPKG